jgi:hypothetical protein
MDTIVMLGMRGTWAAVLAVFVGVVVIGGLAAGPALSQNYNQWYGGQNPTAPKPPPKPAAPKPSANPAAALAPAAAKPGAAVTPAPTQAQTVGKSGEEAPREAKEREEKAPPAPERLADTAAALGTHGLTLTYATIGLIVVTVCLWLMNFLQSRDLKAAVRAVAESSAAARASTALAQRALVLTQRATIIVGEPKAIWLRDDTGQLVGCRLLVTWNNVGTTPTKDMVAAVAGLAADKPPPQSSALPKANARQQPAMVGPQASINSASLNLPVGLVADILEHRAYYLFAGWAEYNDVFDNTPRHRVEFCYWVEFEGDLETQKLEAQFHIHGRHNRHCDSEDGEVRPSRPDPAADTMTEPPKAKYAGNAATNSAGMTA